MNYSDPPKISVIVPVYNTEMFIDRCLNSILEQTFTDFELILIDDNSPDHCPEICEEYTGKDSRIKTIHNTVNQGSSISRKIGLDNASGVYIQFIDSDDWIEKNMFEHLYSTAISENYDIVWHDFFDNDYTYRNQKMEKWDKINIYRNFFDSESKITASVWNKFAKKEIFLHINFPNASQWEDLVITVQLINNAAKINYLPEAFYHHADNPGSISRSTERRTNGLKEILENLAIVIDYCRAWLGADFIKLEPELSACVNRFKFESIFIRELRDSEIFSRLYPESNKNVFSKTWKAHFYKKLFLYVYTKKIPGFYFILDLLKCIKY